MHIVFIVRIITIVYGKFIFCYVHARGVFDRDIDFIHIDLTAGYQTELCYSATIKALVLYAEVVGSVTCLYPLAFTGIPVIVPVVEVKEQLAADMHAVVAEPVIILVRDPEGTPDPHLLGELSGIYHLITESPALGLVVIFNNDLILWCVRGARGYLGILAESEPDILVHSKWERDRVGIRRISRNLAVDGQTIAVQI